MLVKLSIIVPVFNMASDNKLTWCLDSLLNQSINDYEIIAVDDCSTDESFSILLRYADKYPDRFTAIHSEVNLHQGGAKNIGLRAAKGDYVGFIDADDWIDPRMYEKLLRRAWETDADVVGCDYSLVYEHTYEVGSEIVANSHMDQTGVLGHDQKVSLILDGGSLCVKIFRRSLILGNELFFPENIFYEDNAMSDVYLCLANRFEYIPEPLYYYYQHDTSTVHSFSERRCRDRMEAGRIALKNAKKFGLIEEFAPEIEYKFIQLFYINTIFTYMPCVRPAKVSFVKEITEELVATFPDFRSNHYYIERTNAEEKKLINMAVKSPAYFYTFYKMLWGYRNYGRKIMCKK